MPIQTVYIRSLNHCRRRRPSLGRGREFRQTTAPGPPIPLPRRPPAPARFVGNAGVALPERADVLKLKATAEHARKQAGRQAGTKAAAQALNRRERKNRLRLKSDGRRGNSAEEFSKNEQRDLPRGIHRQPWQRLRARSRIGWIDSLILYTGEDAILREQNCISAYHNTTTASVRAIRLSVSLYVVIHVGSLRLRLLRNHSSASRHFSLFLSLPLPSSQAWSGVEGNSGLGPSQH